MAHPQRAEIVSELTEQLEGFFVFGGSIVWDHKNDRWDTGRRSMLAYDPHCSHHVVIQDDVIPCRDLLAGLAYALDWVPKDAPVCGYIGRYQPMLPFLNEATYAANREKASWITMHTLNWGPLVCVPTEAIPEMIAYGDKLTHIPNYDRRLSRYWELERQVRVWYTWPSLVDHRNSPSLVPGRESAKPRKPGGRVAHHFLGTDQSALEVYWGGPVINAVGGPQRELTVTP